MRENSILRFSKVKETEKVDFYRKLDDLHRSGGERFDGELEKSKEEIEAIDVINNLVTNELKELDVCAREPIGVGRVHFVEGDLATKLIGNEFSAVYNHKYDCIFVNRDRFIKSNRLHSYRVLLHEVLHYYSFSSSIASGEENKLLKYRVGYSTLNPFNEKEDHEHLVGFNEVITEKMSKEIVFKNLKFLIEKFGITEDEMSSYKLTSIYESYITFVTDIVNKMASKLNQNPDTFWQNFKKGMFSGEMMHLREVEKVFGPGSLRVLAALGSFGTTKSKSKRESLELIKQFFNTEDQKERDMIADKILSERERLKYKEHQNLSNKK